VYKNGHPLTSPPSSFDIVVVANCVCVQLRAKACQFIGTSLKKDSNVLFLHVSHQLVQLLRIVSVWNSVTVENSQVNVSNVSISCSIVPPTSLGLPIQRLACGLCKVEVRAVRGGLVSEVRGGGVGVGGAWRGAVRGRGVGRGASIGGGVGDSLPLVLALEGGGQPQINP